MNHIATIVPEAAVGLTIPDDIEFSAWVGIGADLARQRRNVDWMIGDWLNAGRDRFGDQVEFDFLADQLGIAPKRLKAVADTVVAFPTHRRDEALSVDHHANVRGLPSDEALSLLQKARAEHWTPEETRIEAQRVHARIGQRSFLDRDDPEYDMLIAIERAWNRATVSVRQQFIDLAAESHLGVIDA